MATTSKQPSTVRALLFVGVLLLIICLGLRWGISSLLSNTEPGLEVGSAAQLASANLDAIPVAVDEATLDALIDAVAAEDRIGYSQIFNSDQVFQVPNGTLVRILDLGFGKTRVRMENGPAIGRSGWVVSEWVQATP